VIDKVEKTMKVENARYGQLFKILTEAVHDYEVQVGIKVEQVTFNRNSLHKDDKITSIFLKTA